MRAGDSSGPPRRVYALTPRGSVRLESATNAVRASKRAIDDYLDRMARAGRGTRGHDGGAGGPGSRGGDGSPGGPGGDGSAGSPGGPGG